jgi:hypothetical protein
VTVPSLDPPDPALAARLLGRVPFRDRLPAGRFRPPIGIIPGDIRSLSSLFLHLAPQPNSLPGVNLTRLSAWVRDVLGDASLGAAIREAEAASSCHVEGCMRVYELVAMRLAQVDAVLAGHASPSAGDPSGGGATT